MRPKKLKDCVKLKWNFQRGWGEEPSMGEVWILSGTTQCDLVPTTLLLSSVITSSAKNVS